MKEEELHPSRQKEALSLSINGTVTVETREAEETRRKEEERWRQLYPEIKKCVVVIARQKLDKLDVLKQKEERRKEEEVGGGGWRSSDPEPDFDWMKPLEMDDISGRFRRFVKKVEVKVSSNHTPDNRCGSPNRGVLRLRHGDVTTDSAHRHHLRSRSVINNVCHSKTDHDYSLVAPSAKGDPNRDTPNSQSENAR